MSYRPDYDIARHGEHKSYALQSERGFAPVGRSDLFAAQLGQPDVEDCSNGVIPDKAEPMDGKKKIHVPVLTTMNKVLFDHYRLSMYTYVNRLLRSGTLSRIVGARMLNRVVNREVLSFPDRPDKLLCRCAGTVEAEDGKGLAGLDRVSGSLVRV